MGFLLGAFGKLSAGRRRREIQSKLLRVRSRLTRATREASNMDKQLQREEKALLNQVKSQAMLAKQAAYDNSAAYQELNNFMSGFQSGTDMSSSDNTRLTYLQTQANSSKLGIDTYYQQYLAQAEQQVTDYIEYKRETQYEPLKAEEGLLQSEKESLESELALADQDYEACKKMEQQGAKDMAPNYTGGGQ